MRRTLWLLVAVAACGGQSRSASPPAEEPVELACHKRRAAYIVTGSMAGPEVGVVMDCAHKGPRIYKWTVLDGEGNKKTIEHSVPPGEFDAAWEAIESTGWRNLGDCDPAGAREGDPVYLFGVQDHGVSVSLRCTGQTLPFPYNRLRNELDLAVARYGE